MLSSRFDQVKLIVTNVAAADVSEGPVSVWTPTTGTRFRIFGWALSLSVAGSIIFDDCLPVVPHTATEAFRTPLLAAGAGQVGKLPFSGYLSIDANYILKLDATASGIINGYIYGVEEI
jgi:hypothetical protein